MKVGSPTAFAAPSLQSTLTAAAIASGHALIIPSGALWGAADIQKMALTGSLADLSIAMTFHPRALRLSPPHSALLDGLTSPTVIAEGSVASLAVIAPNNVNTMAAAAIASGLGFERVRGRLVADPSAAAHVVVVEALGRPNPDGSQFRVESVRSNPAAAHAVTGTATFGAFFASLRMSVGLSAGLHVI